MSDEAGSANTSVTVPGTGTSIELGDLKASIAAELAAELSNPSDIRKRYGLTVAQWDHLKSNPVFRAMLKEALVTWRGSLAAGARITKKAEIMLEDAMPELYGLAKNAAVPSGERIKAIQTIAELAGRGAKQQAPVGAAAQGFTLNIQFSDTKSNVTIDGKATSNE